jgi:hypothetical protein
MKKHLLLFIISSNLLCIKNIGACSYGFSFEDKRPFFEQYDDKKNEEKKDDKKEEKES